MRYHSGRLGLVFAPALLALIIGGSAAHADTVLYSTSFENPPFTTGPIAGQDGWNVFGPGISSVENTFADTGSQAVFVDGGTATQSGPYHADSSTGPLVDVSADIAIFSSTSQSEWQFGALGPGLSQFLGGIDILPNNDIIALTNGNPVIGIFPRATTFDSSAWHQINLLFNIPAQTYSIALDGVTIDSNVAFCGDNGPCSGAPVAAYGDGLFDSFGEDGGTTPTNDSGYMDNYTVTNVTSTPEPSMVPLVLVLAGIGIVLKRKLSSAGA
jgi:hypothetical protein